jgi:hypothetical protein
MAENNSKYYNATKTTPSLEPIDFSKGQRESVLVKSGLKKNDPSVLKSQFVEEIVYGRSK